MDGTYSMSEPFGNVFCVDSCAGLGFPKPILETLVLRWEYILGVTPEYTLGVTPLQGVQHAFTHVHTTSALECFRRLEETRAISSD